MSRSAIYFDGAFVARKLERHLRRSVTSADIVELADAILLREPLRGGELLRCYWYDATPYTGMLQNPIDGSQTNFAGTAIAQENQRRQRALELEQRFAVRRGRLQGVGWKLGRRAMQNIERSGARMIEARDLVPNINQKGVDIRIGLDIARLAMKRLADIVVLVTGDADLVPAMKLARQEGARVCLCALGHGVHDELKAHSDYLIEGVQLDSRLIG